MPTTLTYVRVIQDGTIDVRLSSFAGLYDNTQHHWSILQLKIRVMTLWLSWDNVRVV